MSTSSLVVWIESGVFRDAALSEDFSKSRIEAAPVLGGSMITEDFKSAESRVASIITYVEEARTIR